MPCKKGPSLEDNTPIQTEDQHPESPYGVICDVHEKQGLTKEAYNRQMNRPNEFWRCPICGINAQWDDDRYDNATNRTNRP